MVESFTDCVTGSTLEEEYDKEKTWWQIENTTGRTFQLMVGKSSTLVKKLQVCYLTYKKATPLILGVHLIKILWGYFLKVME